MAILKGWPKKEKRMNMMKLLQACNELVKLRDANTIRDRNGNVVAMKNSLCPTYYSDIDILDIDMLIKQIKSNMIKLPSQALYLIERHYMSTDILLTSTNDLLTTFYFKSQKVVNGEWLVYIDIFNNNGSIKLNFVEIEEE
jgi:hypothetical protein